MNDIPALIAEARRVEANIDLAGSFQAAAMIRRLADALAALTAPQETKSAAKVVPVSYEASASCSHGVCPTGCSHLMWACSACSCEGGWGASRERLEELAAEHVCPPAWGDGDTTDPAFEAWEQELWKHQPVLSMEDGSIRGCQCLDRVFYRGTEDWGTHLAGVFRALSRAAAHEPEWETTLVWDHAHRLDMSPGSRWPDLRTALEKHGHDPALADRADSLADLKAAPDFRAAPQLMRRRKAGPWELVGDDDE